MGLNLTGGKSPNYWQGMKSCLQRNRQNPTRLFHSFISFGLQHDCTAFGARFQIYLLVDCLTCLPTPSLFIHCSYRGRQETACNSSPLLGISSRFVDANKFRDFDMHSVS